MQSAWIRSGGFFVVTTLIAAACTSADGSGGPAFDEAPRTPLGFADAGTGIDADIPDVILVNTGGASSSTSVSNVASSGVSGATSSSNAGTTGPGGAGGKGPSTGAGTSVGPTGVGGFGGGGTPSTSVGPTGVGGFGGGTPSTSVGPTGVGGFGGGGSTGAGTSTSGGGGGASTSASSGMMSGTGGSAPTKPIGATCSAGVDCMSTFCVEGVCCDTACTGLCMSCSSMKKGGVNGVCGPIPNNADPDQECSSLMTACGPPGFCNGAGDCLPPTKVGTVCGPGTCALGSATDPPTCNGSGACISTAPHPCDSMTCAMSVCEKSCTSNTDCPSTQICQMSHCVPKLLLGEACTEGTGAALCGSGFCVDGVCCNSACDVGGCTVCSKIKGATADGFCTGLTGDAPPNVCGTDACTKYTCNAGACDHTGGCFDEACQTSKCDVSLSKPACVLRSKLDGTPCVESGSVGICLAGDCFRDSGTSSSSGAGGAAASTSSASTSESATSSGGGGEGGSGGAPKFHFIGGACALGGADEGRFAWLLAGLILAARRRPRRALGASSPRWSRDA